MSLRAWALALVLAALLWFGFARGSTFAQRSYDLIDPRPARSILIIGNISPGCRRSRRSGGA